MSDFKPGTVAKATVRGVPDVTVFRRYSPDAGVRDWAYNPDPEHGLNYSCDSDVANVVTDVRPLVVLDPENPSLRYFVRNWQDVAPRDKAGTETTVGAARYIA